MPHITSEQGLTLDWLVESGKTYLVVTNQTNDGPMTLSRSIELGGSPTMGVPDNSLELSYLKRRLREQAFVALQSGVGDMTLLEDYVLIVFYHSREKDQMGVKLFFIGEADREITERCNWIRIYWFNKEEFFRFFLEEVIIRTA